MMTKGRVGMDEVKVIEVLAHIERSTETCGVGEVGHYQSDWVQVTDCGTTACMAGWTTLLAGWKPIFYKTEHPRVRGFPVWSADVCRKDGEKREISDLAAELLDVDDDDASALFYDCADLSELYSAVAPRLGVERSVLVDKVQAAAQGLNALVFEPPRKTRP